MVVKKAVDTVATGRIALKRVRAPIRLRLGLRCHLQTFLQNSTLWFLKLVKVLKGKEAIMSLIQKYNVHKSKNVKPTLVYRSTSKLNFATFKRKNYGSSVQMSGGQLRFQETLSFKKVRNDFKFKKPGNEVNIMDFNNNGNPVSYDIKEEKSIIDILPAIAHREVMMLEYLKLLDGRFLKDLWKFDPCYLMTDWYLIAIAFSYIERCVIAPYQFTPRLFVQCLYLACAIEEDDIDLKHDLYAWLYRQSNCLYPKKVFMGDMRKLVKSLDYKTVVHEADCQTIRGMAPQHPIWNRNRSLDHAMILRDYKKNFASRRKSRNSLLCFICEFQREERVKRQVYSTPTCHALSQSSDTLEQGDSGLGHVSNATLLQACSDSSLEWRDEAVKESHFKGSILENL